MGRSAIISIVKGADGLKRRGIVWDRYQMIPATWWVGTLLFESSWATFVLSTHGFDSLNQLVACTLVVISSIMPSLMPFLYFRPVLQPTFMGARPRIWRCALRDSHSHRSS